MDVKKTISEFQTLFLCVSTINFRLMPQGYLISCLLHPYQGALGLKRFTDLHLLFSSNILKNSEVT